MDEPLLNLYNFSMAQKVCQLALRDSEFFSIIGASGSGKSEAMLYFKEKHPDRAKYLEMRRSMKMRDFYMTLGSLFGYTGSSKNMFAISTFLKEYSQMIEHTEVLLIDEGTQLRPQQLAYLHEIREVTKSSIGMVLCAPKDFLRNLEIWDKKGIIGIEEFQRRVQMFKSMKDLKIPEIKAVCKEYGVTDAEIIKHKLTNYRTIGKLCKKIKDLKKYGFEFDDIPPVEQDPE